MPDDAAEAPLHVLMVEDDPDIATVVELALARDSDIVLRCFSRGTDALAHADVTSTRYDLLLVNIMLPDMSGVELVARLVKLPSVARAHITVITGLIGGTQLRLYQEAGARTVITKPFDAVGLAATLRRIHAGEISGVIKPD